MLYLRQTVINDVASKFENQSVEELAQQKIKIQDMLDSGKASVDSEFWEAVLKELHVFQVKGSFFARHFFDVLVLVRYVCLIAFGCLHLRCMYTGIEFQVLDIGLCSVKTSQVSR